MELNRDSIIRNDFPLERRGYDRAAVDAHLDAVAVAVAELVAARVGAGAAGGVSATVESIVSAAEEAARKIEGEAAERAREQEARVAAAAKALLARIDTLREGVEQLAGGLSDTAPRVPSDESGNGAHDKAAAFVAPEPAVEAVAESEPPTLEPDEPPAPGKRSTVVEDARLVALQMLLEGRTRDEVDSYLAEHFELPNRAALVDEVAAAVGG
jgi:DivIVA domain-containing protein